MLTSETAWQKLVQLYQQQRIPHALLLVQERAQQTISLAQQFAQLLLCQQPQSNHACGACHACLWLSQQAHPDFRVLGEDDAACGIDDIRDLQPFFNQKSHQQGYKVVVLKAADKLLAGAANALLKTLEEPLGPVVFILVAQKMPLLLKTIKSRCFTLKLAPTVDNVATEEAKAHINWLEKFAQPKTSADIQQLAAAKPQEALYLFYYFITELIRCRLGVKTEHSYNTDAKQAFNQIVATVSIQQLFEYLDKITQALTKATLTGVNKQLLFEAVYFPWIARSSSME